MIASSLIPDFARWPRLSTLGYFAALLLLVVIIVINLMETVDQYQAVRQSTETLALLQERLARSKTGVEVDAMAGPDGSPFVEGQTATIAGAMLLQHVTRSITQAGGTVVSSEIEPQRVNDKDAFLKVTTMCEIEQLGVQRLLYDIEAGKPFLFVEQLMLQMPAASNEDARLRVQLGIAGRWRPSE